MPFSITLSRLIDSKLRAATKVARHRLREARKLLRRGRKVVPESTVSEIEASVTATRAATKTGDAAAVHKAADKLSALLDKHLGRYRKPAWRESLESILIAVLVALVLRSFVVEAFKIPSGSMIPTLAIGDQIFVNKLLYGVRIPFTAVRLVDFSIPDRGDVIVFICPEEPHDDYIKRVVGLPGDEIAVRDGRVTINSEPLDRELQGQETFWDRDALTQRWYTFDAMVYEETIDGETHTVIHDAEPAAAARDYGPVIVPEGHVFVMGDNRDHSYDSRSWGPVPLPNILGRSLFVWWSWGRDGLDVSRIGTAID
jgi:signal peptidase I